MPLDGPDYQIHGYDNWASASITKTNTVKFSIILNNLGQNAFGDHFYTGIFRGFIFISEPITNRLPHRFT